VGGIFRSFRKMHIKTRSWGLSPKDAFAGKCVFFLALEINSRGVGPLASVFWRQHIDVLYWVQDTQKNKSIKRRLNWHNPAL
jgi:hypothetical protein